MACICQGLLAVRSPQLFILDDTLWLRVLETFIFILQSKFDSSALWSSVPSSPLLSLFYTLQGNPNRCVDVLSHSLMRLKVERVIEIIALSLL